MYELSVKLKRDLFKQIDSMVDKILRLFQTVFFIFLANYSFGQTFVDIAPPTLSFENDRLYITYNINDKNTNYYDVQIEILNSSKIKINAHSLSGDLGSYIKSGKNKTVIWDISKDNVFLDETIFVKIVAELVPKKYNKAILMVQSAIWPGLGQTKLKSGKPYWLVGCAGVTCLAGSYLYNQQSIKSYDKYVTAISVQDSENFYDQAIQQDNTSKILTYSAIGIWAANIIWVAVLPTKSKSGTSSNKLSFYALPVNVRNNNTIVSLGLNLNF